MRHAWIAVVLAALFAGCTYPYGMNMQSQQERKVSESETGKAVAQSDTHYKGPLADNSSLDLKVGDNSTATLTVGKPEAAKPTAEFDHSQNKGSESEAGDDTEEKADWASKNPYTMLLIGIGLVVIVYGLKKLWDLIKNTAAGKAAKLADDSAKRMIDSLRSRMQTETDPKALKALSDAALAAEDAAWKTA